MNFPTVSIMKNSCKIIFNIIEHSFWRSNNNLLMSQCFDGIFDGINFVFTNAVGYHTSLKDSSGLCLSVLKMCVVVYIIKIPETMSSFYAITFCRHNRKVIFGEECFEIKMFFLNEIDDPLATLNFLFLMLISAGCIHYQIITVC